MSFHRRTESVAGKDSLRQYGEIALCLIDRDGLPDLPAAVQDPVALMPGRMYLGLGRALWIGESSREGWPATTVAPFAAKTMSGIPGTGSRRSTRWPLSR